jgi:hypothetical protein
VADVGKVMLHSEILKDGVLGEKVFQEPMEGRAIPLPVSQLVKQMTFGFFGPDVKLGIEGRFAEITRNLRRARPGAPAAGSSCRRYWGQLLTEYDTHKLCRSGRIFFVKNSHVFMVRDAFLHNGRAASSFSLRFGPSARIPVLPIPFLQYPPSPYTSLA